MGVSEEANCVLEPGDPGGGEVFVEGFGKVAGLDMLPDGFAGLGGERGGEGVEVVFPAGQQLLARFARGEDGFEEVETAAGGGEVAQRGED